MTSNNIDCVSVNSLRLTYVADFLFGSWPDWSLIVVAARMSPVGGVIRALFRLFSTSVTRM